MDLPVHSNAARLVAVRRIALLTAIHANPAITHQILFATPPSASAASIVHAFVADLTVAAVAAMAAIEHAGLSREGSVG